ncbi:MAG TPA: DUF3379 family protein [Xanthomonadales bacterium]|nr:DUF3379 family protein [Xanthomonadales bacterium]
MNCIDYRRQLAAVPDALDASALAHEAECPRCTQARGEAQQFEAALRGALAVPVPDSLADRILLHQTTEARRARGVRRRAVAWRVAAVLALAVAGGLFWRVQQVNQPLPDIAVAHLSHEPYALASRAQVPLAQVRTMFAARGVPLPGDPGEVDYLNLCPLGRDAAVHMVVQTDRGPVTVYYVVGRHVPARAVWQRNGVVGRSVPMADGTLVLLADHDDRFDALESRWARALEPAGAAIAQL